MKLVLPLLLGLIAAASGAAAQSVRAELGKLRRQPVQNVIARLGNPQRQEPAAGGTTYYWSNEMRVRNAPMMTERTGYANGLPTTVETMQYGTDIQSCVLTVSVDGAGRITDASTSDANEACASLVRRMAATP